jgi:uncharacterized phage protein gp47/JayE
VLDIPTLDNLKTAAERDIEVEVEVNGSLGARLREAMATALAGIGYWFLLTLQRLSLDFFVDTASEAFALLWASIFGIVPNPATPAQGPVLVTGVNGATLAGGEVLRRADGVEFTVDGPGTIGLVVPGELEAAVTAVVAGTDGNTLTGEVLTFVSPPVNVDSDATVLGIAGQDGLVNGFDAESIKSVKARTLAFIRAPRRGGSEEDYEVWATSIAGISQAYATGSAFGIGTVLVIVAQEYDPTVPGDTPIPPASLINDVENFLETQKPAGLWGVFVQPPVLQNLDPFIVLDPDTPAIRDQVEKSLALNLANVRPGTTAFYDDLVRAIDRAAGEEHHQLFVEDLNNPGNYGPYNTAVGDTSLMVVGSVTWNAPP